MAFPRIPHWSFMSFIFYNPETGFFHKRTNRRGVPYDPPTNGPKLNDLWSHDGYIYVYYASGSKIRADIFAWFFMTGDWPNGEIEHIDGNKNNNAFKNLRMIPPIEEPEESKTKKPELKYKHKGITITISGRYRATLRRGGQIYYLGFFDTEEEAIEAYKTADAMNNSNEITSFIIAQKKKRKALKEMQEKSFSEK